MQKAAPALSRTAGADWYDAPIRKHRTKADDCEFNVLVEIFRTLTPDLEARWRALEQAGYCTPFQRLSFLKPWYRIFAQNSHVSPLFVVVRAKTSGDDLLFFPLCIREKTGHTVIEFADLGLSDYNAPLVSRKRRISRTMMHHIWSEIVTVGLPGDVINFEKLPIKVGRHINPLCYLPRIQRMRFDAHLIKLPASIDDYEKRMLSRGFRDKNRQLVNKLKKGGNLTLEVPEDAKRTNAIFADLVRQRSQRCQALGRENSLDNAAVADFYRELAQEGRTTGHCRLTGLNANGEVIATTLGLYHDHTFHLLIPTFESGTWSRYSLGSLMILMQMRDLRKEGCQAYDLTIGDEPYKQRLGATRTRMLSLSQPLNARGYPRAVLDQTRRAAQQWRSNLHRTLGGINRLSAQGKRTSVGMTLSSLGITKDRRPNRTSQESENPTELNKRAYEKRRIRSAYEQATDLSVPESVILAQLGSTLPLPEGPVLDVGIGGGRTCRALAGLGRPYTGFDFVPEMVAHARERFPGLDLRVMDARDLKAFTDGSQALVWFSFNGLDSIGPGDRAGVLSEIKRVLAPEGLFVFSSHNIAFSGLETRLRPQSPSLTLADPISSARKLAAYVRARRSSKTLREHEQKSTEFAVFNDDAHGHALLQCYIHARRQRKDLEAAGFRLVAMIGSHGEPLAPDADAPTSDSIHYIAEHA